MAHVERYNLYECSSYIGCSGQHCQQVAHRVDLHFLGLFLRCFHLPTTIAYNV